VTTTINAQRESKKPAIFQRSQKKSRAIEFMQKRQVGRTRQARTMEGSTKGIYIRYRAERKKLGNKGKKAPCANMPEEKEAP